MMEPPSAGSAALQGLAPPPRPVPLQIRIDELFGGTTSVLGWSFLGLGLIFVWIFCLNADLSGWRFLAGKAGIAARTTGCRSTSFSEGGSNHSRGRPIYANDFFFQYGGPTGGRVVMGTSYGQQCLQAGRDAVAEFPPGKPEYARLRGMRRAPMPWVLIWIGLFPLIGAGFVYASLRGGLRDIGLLRRGVTARGQVVAKRATGTRINNRPQYELDMAFKDAFGVERRFSTKTCFPEKLEGEGVHNVFYDPDRPGDAISVDALPEPLFADLSGGLASDGWTRAGLSLVPPALTIGGHAAYWLWRLAH